MKCDFSGYATKSNVTCSDGRVILPEAFEASNGMKVPMVWQHDHNSPTNVLGHCELESRPDGVYCRGYFNHTDAAKAAKAAVEHGDVDSLSIYANHLQQEGNKVTHGLIREVSLVLAGANPGAKIDDIAVVHSDGSVNHLSDEAIIQSGEYLAHADEPQEKQGSTASTQESSGDDTSQSSDNKDVTVQDVIDSMTDEQRRVMYWLIAVTAGGVDPEDGPDDDSDEVSHADDTSGKTIQEVFDGMNEDQKTVVQLLVGLAKESSSADKSSDDSDGEGDTEMAHSNIFEKNGEMSAMDQNVYELQHSDVVPKIFSEISSGSYGGSLKKAVIQHAQDYGIQNIDLLFPDAKTIRNTPDFYKRRSEWVNTVLNGTTHIPFSRIKSLVADITGDEARARGYTLDREHNNRKIDEVFSVLRRVTLPQTVYKKQKLDRDDIIDIVDFDVVAWMKQEMRIQLDEEIGRCVLIGDGRSAESPDKVRTDSVRPIAFDDDLYTIKVTLPADQNQAQLVDAIMQSQVDYQGTGNPVLLATPQFVASLMVDRDKIQRRFYANRQELADAMGVSAIVDVPVMSNATDTNGNVLRAIVVNLRDYTIGADRGGEVSMFDDFDIDFNQNKYLIETRVSGALTLPKSAIAIFQAPEAPKA